MPWSGIEPWLLDCHSDIENYNFVLIPLKEIVGEMIHPSLGISMKDLAEQKKFTDKLLKLD